MPAPKESGTTPVAKGITFVKKAKQWAFYKTYNKENVTDLIRWFDTEEKAIEAFKNDI